MAVIAGSNLTEDPQLSSLHLAAIILGSIAAGLFGVALLVLLLRRYCRQRLLLCCALTHQTAPAGKGTEYANPAYDMEKNLQELDTYTPDTSMWDVKPQATVLKDVGDVRDLLRASIYRSQA